MKVELEQVLPEEIEKRSMEIIEEKIREKGVVLDPKLAPVIKRVIHTTADFDYLETLVFSNNAMEDARRALLNGALIVTDTQMALAGINRKALAKMGGEAVCFMADPDVAQAARQSETTRARAAVDKASALQKPIFFAVGNAPTALVRIYELVGEEKLRPAFVVGVPVGFVNVVQSKELMIQSGLPFIVARGQKGGSNVAAAIVNAILYQL